MNYYKYEEDEDNLIGGGTRFVDSSEGRALREVTINGDCFLGSNICYPHRGMMIAEKAVDYDQIEEVTPITREEFDAVWSAHLAQNAGRWAIIKQAYPVGTQVQGRIAVFYPQGVIVDLGDSGTLGIANYHECKASSKLEFLSSKHRVSAIVRGYDELNQWLLLGSPQVHEDRVSDPYWWL